VQGLLLNDQRWLNAPYCFASLQRSQLSSLCLSLFYLALGKGEEEFYDFTLSTHLTLTSSQGRLPAELKHINKPRKRN